MEIKILGTGCANCKALEQQVWQAVSEMGIDAQITKVEDMTDILSYNVMATPALVVDNKVVSAGKKLTKEQVKNLLSK